jgi:hypothetical protein
MFSSNQDIVERVQTDCANGVPVDTIVSYLEEETRKPDEQTKIRLDTFDQNKPNMNPWNTLGFTLLKNKQYEQAEKVWRKVISLAYEHANVRYSGIPPVGAPLNNLSITLFEQEKFNDALIALMDAYTFDIRTGNPGTVARTNFFAMFGRVLSDFMTNYVRIKPAGNALESNERGKTSNQLQIKGYSLMAWYSCLLPSLFGSVMLFLHPENWYFLFLVLLGFVSPALFLYKDYNLKTPVMSVEVKTPPLKR